jgi:nucleoside-diphosphate kinase
MERTLAIVKPDAFKAGHAGEIIDAYLKAGLAIRGMKLIHMTPAQAGGFYLVHKDKKFYAERCAFMSSGPCIVLALEGDNAIQRNRDLMGPTDSTKAPKNTLRGRFGASLQNNAVHGSDAPETAAYEIGYFFNGLELV